jgi:ribosomal protein L32
MAVPKKRRSKEKKHIRQSIWYKKTGLKIKTLLNNLNLFVKGGTCGGI